MNGVPFGTKILVLDGPLAGSTWVVKDRIGCCSQLDFYMATEREALAYGRRQIRIEVLK